MKKELLNDSGIKDEDGRDVITEISGREFKEWIKQYGMNIGIISSDILDGFDVKTNDYKEYRKYINRTKYIAFIDLNTKQIIPREEEQWRKFVEDLEEYL